MKDHLLQEGIKPMWEDERNKKGGRWLINLDKKQRASCLDNFWLEVVSYHHMKGPLERPGNQKDFENVEFGIGGKSKLCNVRH